MTDSMLGLVLKERTKISLYLVLLMKRGGEPGLLEDVDICEVVKWCDLRGIVFSETQVRLRLKELERARLVERFGTGRKGKFDLNVLGAEENFDRFNDENDREKNVDGGGEDDFAPLTRIKSRVAKRTKRRVCSQLIKPTNQLTNNENFDSNRGTRIAASPGDSTEPEPSADKSAANVRSLIDFEEPETRKLRAEVSRTIYEYGVREDLVDRVTAAIRLKLPGFESISDLKRAKARADSETRLYERTDGRRGKRFGWETINLVVWDAYEAAGYLYPRMRRGRELSPFKPRPTSKPPVETPKPQPTTSPEPSPKHELTVDELAKRCAGFEIADADLKFDELARKVARVRGVSGVAAQMAALTLRQDLKRLKALKNALI